MKALKVFSILILLSGLLVIHPLEAAEQTFYPQVPFNFLYAGGVECSFIRVHHPQWDAVEFMTTASGGISLMNSMLDGIQVHYLHDKDLVQLRKQFDTSSKPRDYRYAPMEYQSKIGEDGRVEIVFTAKTDLGRFDVSFFSSNSLKEMNHVVNPLNHAMEVIPILYMEKTVGGDDRTRVLLDDKPLKIKSKSFTLGANYGIIYRTDKRIEKLEKFRPGYEGLVGTRWLYDVDGRRVTYSISKDRDTEGYYEVKRLAGFVQKAWVRPSDKGREVKKISTYSLVHDNKEFIIEFNPPLFFPSTMQGKPSFRSYSDFRAKISNSGWDVKGNVKVMSKGTTGGMDHDVEFLPTFPEFLAKRPVFYKVSEGANFYKVFAMEER
jgi:hypothetical protein